MIEEKQYWVVDIGAGYTLEDAKEYDDTSTTRYGFEDALEIWLKYSERNGYFADGYPNYQKYLVVDCDTGEEKLLEVQTEWSADFYISEVE